MTTASPLVTSAPTTTFPFTASTSFAACTWIGHCLGSPCSSWDDCDNDWVCKNGICSPCCLTGGIQSSAATGSFTTSAPSSTSETQKTGLSSGAAAGIGVGVVAFVAIAVGIGAWMWFRKRQRNRGQSMPSPHENSMHPPPELSTTTYYGEVPGKPADDLRKLEGATPVELSVQNPPVESSGTELVELEGDDGKRAPSYTESKQPPVDLNEQDRKPAPG